MGKNADGITTATVVASTSSHGHHWRWYPCLMVMVTWGR